MHSNSELPILSHKDEIKYMVRDNPVTIITAETGAGKSTQVLQYLLEDGYDLIVTQPRVVAARTIAERVAEEFGCELGDTIGYRTAKEGVSGRNTRCLLCTDGLALVRELMGNRKHQVLVLDEVHEWNTNLEVLVAWVKHQLEVGATFKVVLMSATLEAERLSAYFNNAPIISVGGRLYPVTVEAPQGMDEVQDIVRLLRAGRNVLNFQPGKAEIANVIGQLEELRRTGGINAEILPLHGELEPAEQRRCFARYNRPKVVVATNVAQTSITIEDIDAVVDSGMERRKEVVDGVEGLYLKPISLADSKQRMGRAGRTKPGIYIDWCKDIDRSEFPVAEILRSRLDQTVLRLAAAGFDMEELNFFHQPNKAEIHEAKRALRVLGCLTDKGEVTQIGREVSQLPVSVHIARMLVEADRLGVVGDILTIAAILEQNGGITMRPRGKFGVQLWLPLCQGEEKSDPLAQLAVWKRAEGMRSREEMEQNGINRRSFFKAKELRQHLVDALYGKVRNFGSNGKRENILQAVCTGMLDHVYRKNEMGSWVNGDTTGRTLARESVVKYSSGLVIGLPIDIEIPGRFGKIKLSLVGMVTEISPDMLLKIAPHLVKVETRHVYAPNLDMCVMTSKTYFNGLLIKEETTQAADHEQAPAALARWYAQAYSSVQDETRSWNRRAGKNVFRILSEDELADQFQVKLNGARNRAGAIAGIELTILDPDKVEKIVRDNPERIDVSGQDERVRYLSEYPVVMINFFGWSDRVEKIPAEGINLPGGREVWFSGFVRGTHHMVELPSSQFMALVRSQITKPVSAPRPQVKPELPAAPKQAFESLRTTPTTKRSDGSGLNSLGGALEKLGL